MEALTDAELMELVRVKWAGFFSTGQLIGVGILHKHIARQVILTGHHFTILNF